jgi:hypothetical protein
MNCTSFREAVHDFDRDDVLDAATYEVAVTHAQACTRCARLLYRVRRLDASLRVLARADEQRGAGFQVESELLSAFHARAPRRLRAVRALPWLGAAAVMVIVAGGSLLVRYRRWTPVRSLPAPVATAAPAVASGSSPAAPARVLASAPHPRANARRAMSATKAGQPEELEDLAEFIPLPYADDDAPLGAGELVRVRLSESSLGALGLPVGGDAQTQVVTADVLIGEDGVARAIRFLPGSSELAPVLDSKQEE